MVGVPNTLYWLVRHHTNGVLLVWCVAHHIFYSEVVHSTLYILLIILGLKAIFVLVTTKNEQMILRGAGGILAS